MKLFTHYKKRFLQQTVENPHQFFRAVLHGIGKLARFIKPDYRLNPRVHIIDVIIVPDVVDALCDRRVGKFAERVVVVIGHHHFDRRVCDFRPVAPRLPDKRPAHLLPVVAAESGHAARVVELHGVDGRRAERVGMVGHSGEIAPR